MRDLIFDSMFAFNLQWNFYTVLSRMQAHSEPELWRHCITHRGITGTNA